MSSTLPKEVTSSSIEGTVEKVKVENGRSMVTFDGNNWFKVAQGDEELNIFVLLSIALLIQRKVHAELTNTEISAASLMK